MKYSKWIGIAGCVLIIVACFLPWTYHADLGKSFTGFFSENDTYGKPGKVYIFLSVVSIILLLTPRVFAKRVQLFIAGLIIAYSIKTYTLFTSCYNAYCPIKQYGLYLLLGGALIVLFASLFPDLKLVKSSIKKGTD